jgi:hypothetical protein
MMVRHLTKTLPMATLAAAIYANTAVADDASPPAAPLAMRIEHPIVYATPIKNVVILEFKLYDNKTWCRLYIEKQTWDAIRANGGKLPSGADRGQLQCEQR